MLLAHVFYHLLFEWKKGECFYFNSPYLFCMKNYFTSELLLCLLTPRRSLGAKARSSFPLVSPVCINAGDLSFADWFSLIDESKDVVPARQLFSSSLAPQRASLLPDIRRRSKEGKHCQPAVWAFESSNHFLPEGDWFLVTGGQAFLQCLDKKVSWLW